ncbi:hypothetical protein MMC10_000910 [Thelotrema lepadinum]|nr:hypothetical protein [Thelotrema lepadinum]
MDINYSGLEFLREYLGVAGDGPKDATFVAIDFENLSNIRPESCQGLNYQAGVATFDTKSINSKSRTQKIRTFNFVAGSPTYCAYATWRFLFGKTVQVDSHTELVSNIERLFPREAKSIILVGHNIPNDLVVLQRLGFDTQTSILGILDTARIASTIFLEHNISLRDLLVRLQCPWDKLHNAGNDAHFSLRALLLLAVKDLTAADQTVEESLTSIETIASLPVPHKLTPDEKALKRKRQWYEKTLKFKAKSRTIETQEQIRAERALRRQERELKAERMEIEL